MESYSNHKNILFNSNKKFSDNVKSINEATQSFELKSRLGENFINCITNEAILNENYILNEAENINDSTKKKKLDSNTKTWIDNVIEWIKKKIKYLKKLAVTVIKNLFDITYKMEKYANENEAKIKSNKKVDLLGLKLHEFTARYDAEENKKDKNLKYFPSISELGISNGKVISKVVPANGFEDTRSLIHISKSMKNNINTIKRDLKSNEQKLQELLRKGGGLSLEGMNEFTEEYISCRVTIDICNQKITNITSLIINTTRAMKKAVKDSKNN